MQVWNLLHAAHLKYPGCKNLPSAHHRTTLSGYIFTSKAHIDNLKKRIKQQYPLHMSSQYGELRPTEIGWWVWGTPANFSGLRVLASLLHRRHSTKVNQTAWCLAVFWTGTLYIYTFLGATAFNGILPDATILVVWSTAFNRGRHLYSAGQPSRWASAHSLVVLCCQYQWSWLPGKTVPEMCHERR